MISQKTFSNKLIFSKVATPTHHFYYQCRYDAGQTRTISKTFFSCSYVPEDGDTGWRSANQWVTNLYNTDSARPVRHAVLLQTLVWTHNHCLSNRLTLSFCFKHPHPPLQPLPHMCQVKQEMGQKGNKILSIQIKHILICVEQSSLFMMHHERSRES